MHTVIHFLKCHLDRKMDSGCSTWNFLFCPHPLIVLSFRSFNGSFLKRRNGSGTVTFDARNGSSGSKVHGKINSERYTGNYFPSQSSHTDSIQRFNSGR